MKKLLTFLGLSKKEMTLDEYIISIRPKTRELSHVYTTVHFKKPVRVKSENNDDGPEEAGCLVPA